MLRNDQKPMVSIIVPVYNMERYIERCIDSLLKQTYQKLEIILVNDGSTDRTGEICDIYCQKYASILKTEHCTHGGVSSARLTGVKKANGVYIAFVDADDWIEKDYIESMLCDIGRADIVAAGIAQETEEKKKIVCEYNGISAGSYGTDSEKKKLLKKMLYCAEPYQFGVLPYMCNKLFKKCMLQPFMEQTDKRVFDGEDALVIYPYLLSAQEIVLTDTCKYHYVMHSDSASLKDTTDAYLNVSYLYQGLYKYFKENVYHEILMEQLDHYMRRMVWKKDPAAYLRVNSYYFPYSKVREGSKIVLYGMGKIGNVFCQQIMQTTYCKIVAWADQDPLCPLKIDVSVPRILPEQITEYFFDYVVIAIGNQDIICVVFEKLLSMKIAENKIVRLDG